MVCGREVVLLVVVLCVLGAQRSECRRVKDILQVQREKPISWNDAVIEALLHGVPHENSKEETQCSTSAYPPPKGTVKVPTEIVNLDSDPKVRWNDIVIKRTPDLIALLDWMKNFTSFAFHGKLFDIIDAYLPLVIGKLPKPYGDEITGISIATGIKQGEVLLYNIFYEIFTVCTSIVAENPEGKLFHARNLDFGLLLGWDNKTDTWELTELLRPLIVNVDFQRGGKTVYKSVHFAGYIGVITGIKPGVLTLTLNERFNEDGGYIGIVEWILGKRDGHWTSFLTRDVLDKATSYDMGMNMLANTTLLAPVYYIVGGNISGQGAVITRARTKSLNIMKLDPSKQRWFVLETNYDNWKPPLFIDDRRTPGEFCMKNMTQKSVSFTGLYNVLSTIPVLNKLTAYTALMQVDSGDLETWIRHCKTPCFPW